jgi:Lipocalin-like domain
VKAIRIATLTAIAVINGVAQTHAADKTDRDKLIGAWHLTTIVGPDGKRVTTGLPTGMLIYTRDGHISVQLMYPKSASALSNEYVHNGYEASFGSYEVNESAHTVTHHVMGSNTGDLLVGKDLPRVYQFSADGQLTIKSARPDESWSVRWEHY